MKRTFRPLFALAALALSAPAYALTCDEIMNMVNVKVPTNIVVQTMKDSGETFSAADVKCLIESGAPSDVVAQAKSMTPQEAPPPTTTKPTTTTPAKPTSTMDKDEDVIGGRTSTKPKTTSSKTTKDLTDKGEDSSVLPDAIQQAVNLIDAKKPLTASLMLFEALESGSYPDDELVLHYFLARSLADLELYSAAQYHYTWVIKALVASDRLNSEYFTNSLAKLVAISRLSGDNSELIRLLPKLTPEQYPRGAQDTLYYLGGLRYFEEDQLSDARKFFAQVSQKSPLYLKSKYLEGVIFNKQGKFKSAVKAFAEVTNEPIITSDPDELRRTQDLKDLAIIDVARIYYAIERYEKSAYYYDQVNRDSSYWGEALFEDAWTRFMQNDLNVALGKLLTVRSPFFIRDEFVPEATVLRALTFFNLCQYPEVEKTLLDFEDRYRPMQAEMRDFVQGYLTDEGKQLADQAWDAYFGAGQKKETKLPKSLFNRILLNQDLSAIVTRLEMMDKEEQIIDLQKSRWKDSLGNNLKDLMEKDRARLKRRAGLLFLSEMARQANYLNDLLTQSEIIRFEVVDAQRVDYQYKMQNPESLKTYQTNNIDFATSVDFIYWPFNGEFWKDELGYYIYTEKAACK